jgi:hypothetical protein
MSAEMARHEQLLKRGERGMLYSTWREGGLYDNVELGIKTIELVSTF